MNHEFWQTEKGKSLIKLLLWLVFIGVIYIVFINIGSNKPIENKEVEKEQIKENILDLNNKNYTYTYKINTLDDYIIFNGYVLNNIDIGYKETKDKIIKYQIENNLVYEINFEEQKEIFDLYDNLIREFLDYNSLYNIIKKIKIEEDNWEFNYQDYLFKINNLDNGFNIIINNDIVTYDLTYYLWRE